MKIYANLREKASRRHRSRGVVANDRLEEMAAIGYNTLFGCIKAFHGSAHLRVPPFRTVRVSHGSKEITSQPVCSAIDPRE